MKTPALCAFFSLFIIAAAHAQLQWETQTVELTSAAGDATATAHFKFENTGSTEVKIESATPSCGCTSATVSGTNFAPHAKGEVTATFHVGQRNGLQQKEILVRSNDPAHPETMLTLKVHIPEVVRVTPTFLHWQRNDPLTPKQITVTVLNDYPVHNLTVIPSDPNFSTSVEAVNGGKEYRIIVTPPQSAEPKGALLTIGADFPATNPKTYMVNLWVK